MSKDQKKKDDLPEKKSGDFPIQEYKLVPVDYETGTNSEDEIDLIELVKTIWNNRKTIYRFVAVGAVLGVLVALLSPKEYVSSATLMPEYSTESQGGTSSLLRQYGGLIGLSGGTYNASSNAIRVDLYPQIVQSLTFQDNLAKQKFYFSKEDTTASLYAYYSEIRSPGVLEYFKKFTIGLPGIILGLFKSDNKEFGHVLTDAEAIVELSRSQVQIIKALREQVGVKLDEESGVVSVSARMSEPRLAAEVAKYTIEELTDYLIEYRTEKVLRDLDFIEEQLGTAKERFEEVQLLLADFRDSNQGNLTARARTEEQRLQSEYDIAFNVYNTLTQQFEEAKLKVQEETPVFKVLQPVQVPVDDETSGAIVVIISVMFSGILGIVWVFLSRFLVKFSAKMS